MKGQKNCQVGSVLRSRVLVESSRCEVRLGQVWHYTSDVEVDIFGVQMALYLGWLWW